MSDGNTTIAPSIPGLPPLDEVLAQINAAWAGAVTPMPMRAQMLAMAKEHSEALKELGADVATRAMAFVGTVDGRTDDDAPINELAMRISIDAMVKSAALLAIILKRELGEPFDPARFAICAYAVARGAYEGYEAWEVETGAQAAFATPAPADAEGEGEAAQIPSAADLQTFVCEHGHMTITLLDAGGEPFAQAGMAEPDAILLIKYLVERYGGAVNFPAASRMPVSHGKPN